jgi:hypothetical protein
MLGKTAIIYAVCSSSINRTSSLACLAKFRRIKKRLRRLSDEDLGGTHRVLPRRTSLTVAVNARRLPHLVFLDRE